MSKVMRFIAITLIIIFGAILLMSCDTGTPQQTNDCRVDDDHDSMDVLKGCPAKGKNSVELKTK